jgi:hypothetical protein
MGYFRGLFGAMILAVLAIPAAATPINLLSNSNFAQTWNNWETFAITGSVWADLHPTSSPGNWPDAAHVVTSGRGGLAQVFLPWNTGPDDLLSSVWVYVDSGQVGMGVGNGGDTGFDVTSQFTGRLGETFRQKRRCTGKRVHCVWIRWRRLLRGTASGRRPRARAQ